jgi:hypothetical protein
MRRTVDVSTRRARGSERRAGVRPSGRWISGAARGAFFAASVAVASLALGQPRDKDGVPLPPRLESTPAQRAAPTPSATVYRPLAIPSVASIAPENDARPPNAARLAPLPENRSDKTEIEEIVVRGEGWRLPDLGSGWREKQAEADDTDRPHVTWVPLYDPEHPTTFNDTWVLNRELTRVGYIDLFRFRFGKRSKPEPDQ